LLRLIAVLIATVLALAVAPARAQTVLAVVIGRQGAADCLLIRPPHAPAAAAGSAVPILPLR
jgi:hypothetical protein